MSLVDRILEPLHRALWMIDDNLDVWDPLLDDEPWTWPEGPAA